MAAPELDAPGSSPATYPSPSQPPSAQIETARGIFCNRTLSIRGVRAIGYDMDYTLIHYRTEAWERHVYAFAKSRLASQGWPVAELHFVPDLMVRGLILDTQLGNVLKVNSFGYVKQATHGTQSMSHEQQRSVYAQERVTLSDRRWVFLNTLFSLSEACLYAQLVDLLEAQLLPSVLGYEELYRRVRDLIDQAHIEGELKAEIMSQPERFVSLDADCPQTLWDQHQAGKKLMLITNSDWQYTRRMMAYVFDRFLPAGMHWRQLFHFVLVAARKPGFFSQRSAAFEVVEDDGLLRPIVGGMREGRIYWGGDATLVEETLGLKGDQILYVGDHIWGDVNLSKTLMRWRTCLVLRELEQDLAALEAFAELQARLDALMHEKERLEHHISHLRLALVRRAAAAGAAGLQDAIGQIRADILAIDEAIRPLVEQASRVGNPWWGPILRAGNDRSHLARQIERHADIYTSRVSNFLVRTPFAYLRSSRASLPHDPSGAPSGSL